MRLLLDIKALTVGGGVEMWSRDKTASFFEKQLARIHCFWMEVYDDDEGSGVHPLGVAQSFSQADDEEWIVVVVRCEI